MTETLMIDRRLIELAGATAGVCTRRQLRRCGLSTSAIDRRVRSGLLVSTGPGLYVVAGLESAATPVFRAVLGVPGSALSHHSAARVHGLPTGADCGVVHVLSSGRHRGLDAVAVHHTRRLDPLELVEVRPGLMATNPVRTVTDLAAEVRPSRLRHLIETGVRDRILSLDDLTTELAATSGRGVPGLARLRQVVDSLVTDQGVPGSPLERAVGRLLMAHGITGFARQVRPPWYDGIRGTVDFAHREAEIVLEADGRSWHRRDQDMAADRRRDRLAAANGWVTIRVMWDDVTRRPATTAAEITAVVAARTAG